MSTPPPFGMSTPPPPPPPPPSSSRKGCFIAIGASAVVLLLLCFVGCFIVGRNPGRMMAWGISASRAGFQQALAADVPQPARDQFMQELDAHVEWLRSATPAEIQGKGQAVAAPMQYLQGALADKSLTADEVQRFIEMSMELRGAQPPAPTQPVPEPEPVPEAAPEAPAGSGEAPPAGETPPAPAGGEGAPATP